MSKLFGIPMQDIMVTLLGIMGACLLAVAFIAWRNRTMFWLGVRNIPRRKAQTVLIVFGLMLATTIIASALTIGDTLAYSIKKGAYDGAGPIDLVVVRGQEGPGGRVARAEGASAYFDRAGFEGVRAKVAGNADIDGIAPAIVERAPVVDQRSRQSEPVALVLGLDPADAAALGGLATQEGGTIDLAALAAGEIVINAALAESLGAQLGDELVVFVPDGPRPFRVARVARDGGLGGFDTAVKGAVILPARGAGTLVGQEGEFNQILVSARGDARGGLAHEPAALDAIKEAVAGTGLAVDPIKRRAVDAADGAGNTFTSFFLIFGLFAIAAGVMLIFLIFVMLAAERRGEMGMARAIGTKRRHLVQSFVAEGAAYDLLAAGIGAGLGVAVAFGITETMARLFGEDIAITPHVEGRSLVVAYCLGVVVTFITIAVSSWRVSRLNIVAAIRDLEETKRGGRGWRGLLFGFLGVGLGLLLAGSAGERAAPFGFGVSLAILAATLILQRLRLPSRLVYTLAGAALVAFWALPAATSERLFGKHTGGIEMFFVSGIMMVAGAVLLLINNGDLLLAGIGALGGPLRGAGPALKMGAAYPLASRFRTGLTLYMFALIIFVLVVMAAINVNYDRLFSDPARQTGGWDVVGQTLPTAPVAGDALRATLAAGGVAEADVVAIGAASRLEPSQTQLRTVGGARPAGTFPINGVDDAWLAHTNYHLQQRATGYADDAAVWRAMRADPTLVVVDTLALPGGGNAAGYDLGDWRVEGITAGGKEFAPRQVELRSPVTGQARTVTIIGVTDTYLLNMLGMYAHQATVDQVFGPQPAVNYLFKLRPGADDAALAKGIEAAFLRHGMQAESLHEIAAETNRTNAGFFALLQGFIGLGLVVGIAALGVVAFRAVVERRQQIGMLRAIGFPRALVSASFLIESLFITGLGIVAGVTTALILARNLFQDGTFANSDGATFFVPWDQIALFAAVAIAAALLMTVIPARQAGRVQPAEALRYE